MKNNLCRILLVTVAFSLMGSGLCLGNELNINVNQPPAGLPGAVPNDGKDDSHAFRQALDYLVQQTKKLKVDGEREDRCGTLFVPAGVYQFDQRVKLNTQCLNITIYGESEATTVLQSNNSKGVFDFDFRPPGMSRVRISNLTFEAAIQGAGTAIDMFRKVPGGYVRGVHLSEVTIKGADGECYFNTGIRIENFLRVLIDKVKFSGPAYAGDVSDSAAIFKPRRGMVLVNCHTPEISNSKIAGCHTGILWIGEDPYWPEAGIIRNNDIDFCRNAIHIDYHKMWAATAGLCVSENRIKARDYGLILRNRKGVFITENRFFDLAGEASSNRHPLTDILLKGTPRVIVSGNWFEKPKDKDIRINVKIDSDRIGMDKPKQTSSDCVLLRNNVFNNAPENAIVVPDSQENTRLLQFAENTFLKDPDKEDSRPLPPSNCVAIDYSEPDYLGADCVVDVVNSSLLNKTATPNDHRDDTEAFQQALDLIKSKGKGTLYIPAGVYEISRPLTVDADRIRLNIIGDGLNVSRLAFRAADGNLLDIKAKQAGSKVVIKGLRLYPRNPVDGAAINLQMNPKDTASDHAVLVKDILVEDVSGETVDKNGKRLPAGYFKTGLAIHGATSPIVHSLTVRGYRNKETQFDVAMVDLLKKFNCTGIKLTDCPHPEIISTYVWLKNKGIVFESCPNSVVVASTSVSCNEAIVLNHSPGALLKLNHVNGYGRNYIINNSDNVVLDEELAYRRGSWDGETKNFRDISIINSDKATVVDSIFWHSHQNSEERTAVIADENSKDVQVVGNIIKHGSKDGSILINHVTPDTRVDANNHNGFLPSDLKNSRSPVFGFWRMNELIEEGQKTYIPDEDALNPDRNNRLIVVNGTLTDGHFRAWHPKGKKCLEQDFGKGLFFSGDTYAVTKKKWKGSSDLSVELYVKPDRAVKKTQTLVSCPDRFSVTLEKNTVVFRFREGDGTERSSLFLPLKRGRYVWYYIRAVVDSEAKKAWIEVMPYTEDGRQGSDAGLKKISLKNISPSESSESRMPGKPVYIGVADDHRSDPLKNGIIDHLYIRGGD